MRKKSLFLAIILLFVMIVPQTFAKMDLFKLSRDENGILTVNGTTAANSTVTVRSIYFGEQEPTFPSGIDNYEISAQQVNNKTVDMNFFNVVQADLQGKYSATYKLGNYGYYLITAVTNNGERKSQLYNYNVSTSDLLPPENAGLKYTDTAKTFDIGGSKFVLLNIGTSETILMPYSDIGTSDGYGLAEYLASVPLKLPTELKNYVTNVSLADSQIFKKYSAEVGVADGVGYFANDVWSVRTNGLDNRDFEKYAMGNINELSDGLYLENINFGGLVPRITQKANRETVIEFNVPTSDTYTINTNLSGAGAIKAQLTALRGEKIFDNNSLMTVMYSAAEITKRNTVTLSAGDKLYLHLYPTNGDVNLNYTISGGGKTYNFADFGTHTNKWWTAGANGDNGYAYSMNTTDFGSVVPVSNAKELFVRPVIYVNNDFFKTCKLDIANAGAEVLSAMRTKFKQTDMPQYDKYELATIFDEFGGFSFEVLPFTDGNNGIVNTIANGKLNANVKITNSSNLTKKLSFIMAVYSAAGTLIATNFADISSVGKSTADFSVSVNLENVAAGTVAKTFLWNSTGGMMPISQITAREMLTSRLVDTNSANLGNWSFYTKAPNSTNYDAYMPQTLTGTADVSTSPSLPFASWRYMNSENNIYIRPEKGGSQVISYTIPYKGNWKVDISWRNIGVDTTLGGDGGSMSMTYLPKNDTDDSRVFRSIPVFVSTATPTSNSYNTVIAANGGDKILLSTDANKDGYGDRWEVKYTISETDKQGDVIGEGYKTNLPQITENKTTSKAQVKEGTVWVGVDGTFGDSEAMKKKILYLKKFVPNIGVILMTTRPETNCNSEFYEQNGIPVLVQSFGAGYEKYIGANNAWEWDWDSRPLDEKHWQDLSGTAHAFALPHFATREVFSRIAKSASTSGYNGFGFPDYVWMWGARGISGYNPETIAAFVEDLSMRDSGLVCDDGVWTFHDYYRYYTGSNTQITPADLRLTSWEEYKPLSSAKNTEYKNAGIDTTPYWAMFDMLCHYEWLKFAQYISNVTHDNGGICQIMINPEYYPDGVDYLFLNKLVNVDMSEDEYFGNTDYLDGAYYRSGYLTKFDSTTKTGGVMEAGGGGNGGAYYTDEIAYLSAFELGALKSIDHLETDFMYQNEGFSQERDGQIASYAMGFSAAKTFNLDRKPAEFVAISSRNQSRPWAINTSWKPWSLRLGYEGNVDFALAKMGHNFDSISQEGIKDINNEKVVVFSPHRVTQSVWNNFLNKIASGSIHTGIMSAHRIDKAITDKLTMIPFAEAAPEYNYTQLTEIGLSGNVKDLNNNNVKDGKRQIKGGLYTPMQGDKTVLNFRTVSKSYPLVVKRTVGAGEMYILLFDDSNAENYEISEIVYDYLLGLSGIKPMFKSVTNTGTLVNGFTSTEEHKAAITADLGASVRMYQNGELTVAGVQNSLARVNAQSTLTSTKTCAPYEISGTTSVKVLMKPNESYKYIAAPSMMEGVVTADAEGYATLSFNNTSHEIFFFLPANSTANFDNVKTMQNQWRTALQFNLK